MTEFYVNAAAPSDAEKDAFIEILKTAIQNAAFDKVQPCSLFRNLPKFEPEESEEEFQKYAIGGYIFQNYSS